MSRGKRRGCCRALARYDTCPCWDSQRVASQGMGAPSNSNRGDQVRCPLLSAASSRLSMDFILLSFGSLPFFCYLAFWGLTSPSSSSSTGLFCLRFGMGCSAGSMEGGGRVAGTCSLVAYLEDCLLFLLDIRPLRPDLGFKSMPSSSISWLVSI